EQKDRWAVLRVRDTGVGIAPDLLPHVFDLFTQADRSLDRSQGGLGIGLTMVQRLVQLHGGAVEARSEGLGRGSEFIVRLPILDFARESEATTRAACPGQVPSPGVLILDCPDKDEQSRGQALSVAADNPKSKRPDPAGAHGVGGGPSLHSPARNPQSV